MDVAGLGLLGALADIRDPSQLVAPVGATALLVYLIGVIVQERRQATRDRMAERRQWEHDRTALITEHEAAMAKAGVDRERTISYLRGEVEVLHKRLNAVEERHADCRASILALEDQVRELQGRLP